MTNLILNTDSYKHSQFPQYPKGTTKVSSYCESRGGEFPESVFFGLYPYLKLLEKGVSNADIREAKALCAKHFVPFNESGWRYIVDKYNGRLPLLITAVPEGTVMRVSLPLVQIVNTDEDCEWLTSFLESGLLRLFGC